MAAFAWDGRQLADPDALGRHLATLQAPAWARGVTIHHTWRPRLEDWRGAATMAGLRRYYEKDVRWVDAKGQTQYGWPSGPHLFIAPDGYWLGTPFTTQGTHAGAYNRTMWGIEVVGDYDVHPFSPATEQQIISAVVSLFRWKGIPQSNLDTVRGHRECGSSKSCPGTANDMGRLRDIIDTALHASRVISFQRYRIQSDDGWAAVRIAPHLRAPRALNGTARLATGTVVEIDTWETTESGRWGHLAHTNTMRDLGFIHSSLLVPVEATP